MRLIYHRWKGICLLTVNLLQDRPAQAIYQPRPRPRAEEPSPRNSGMLVLATNYCATSEALFQITQRVAWKKTEFMACEVDHRSVVHCSSSQYYTIKVC